MTVTHLTGQALNQVQALPDASIDLVASSPPFLALRNYNNIPGQWGSEATPAAFLDNLLTLATEIRRVLTPWGSLAFELGDTYSGSGGGGGDYLPGGIRDGQLAFAGSARAHNAAHWRAKQEAKTEWPLAKSLTGVPTLFAWSLAYGRNLLNPDHTFAPWRIRNVIVWARNNPPVGALGDKVRPATSYITVACPSDRRWFDLDAVRVPADPSNARPSALLRTGIPGRSDQVCNPIGTDGQRVISNPAGAPPLDHWHDQYDGDTTWLINTAGSSLAHYAMWPAKLAERLILSMCPAQVCTSCGEPRRRITETPNVARTDAVRFVESSRRANADETNAWRELTGSTCADYRPGLVLDPFSGSGTTLAVADIHGRDAIGIDLDPANRAFYERRWAECWRALRPDAGPSPVTEHGEQLRLA